MTERTQVIKGTIRILFVSTLIFAILFVVSCDNGNDPEPELYPLPGIYTFNKAILQTTLELPGIPIPISSGTDITDEMAGGLLAEAPCDDSANGAVELKESKELFFTCIGESNEAKAGTWSINGDTTELSLNMASPPLPSALKLTVEDLVINESTNIIGGSILNFPLTPDLIAGFLQGYGLSQAQIDAIIAGLPPATLVNVDIEFQKVTQ